MYLQNIINKSVSSSSSFYKNYIYFSDDIYTFKAKQVEQTYKNKHINKKDSKKYNFLLKEIKNRSSKS